MKVNMASTIMKTEVKFVNPELAQLYLNLNTIENRRPHKGTIMKIAKDIKNGLWICTGEPLIFSKSGRLLNGQHRLLAIISANKGVNINVCVGVSEDAFKKMDNGRIRRVEDLIHVQKQVVEVCRLAGSLYNQKYAVTQERVNDIANQGYYDAHVALKGFCGKGTSQYCAAPARLAACSLIVSGSDEKYVMESYSRLANQKMDGTMTKQEQAFSEMVNARRNEKFRDDKNYVIACFLTVFDPANAALKTFTKPTPDVVKEKIEFIKSIIGPDEE